MKYIYSILFILIGLGNIISQHNEVDSLLQLLDTDIPDSTRMEVYDRIGRWYEYSNASKSIEFYINGLAIAKNIGTKYDLASFYYSLGYCYRLSSDYDQSLENYLQSVRLYEEMNDSLRLSNAYLSIANIYGENDDLESLNRYLDQSEAIIIGLQDSQQLSVLYNQKGMLHDRQGVYDTARIYHQLAYDIAIQIDDIPDATSALSNLGLTYKHMQQDEKALQTFQKVIEIFDQIDADPFDYSIVYNNIGATNAQKGNYAAAESAFLKSLDYANNSGAIYVTMEDYSNLSDMYGDMKNYKDQVFYSQKYHALKDSLFTLDKANQLTQLEADYTIEKKNSEILKQEGEIEKQKNQRNLFIWLSIFGALILGLVTWFYSRIKKKNGLLESQNALISKQKLDLESTVTNLKLTQKQLIQSEKMASLGELTAGIAHEIQNPLNFVNNFSEVSAELIEEMTEEIGKGDMQEVKDISNNLRENLEKIIHHGKRASGIVKSMLDHSRTGTNEKLPTNINELCEEYLRLSYHGLRAKDKTFNASLETNFDLKLKDLTVVPQDIGRVILNVFNNAFYALKAKTPDSGDSDFNPKLSVSTKTLNGFAEISIEDNGIGMPESLKQKIFQPFYTTKPTGSGTGLGLSLAYDIVKAHNGDITVHSEEGQGTTFIIRLPLR